MKKKLLSVLLLVSVAASGMLLSACEQKKPNQSDASSKVSAVSTPQISRVTPASSDPMEVSMDEKKPRMTEAQLTDLNKKVTAAQAIPSFTSTSEKLDCWEIGKTLTVSLISENSSASFQSELERNFKRTADRLGVKTVTSAETDSSVSSLNDALAQAVQDKNGMIMLSGDIMKDTIAGSIELAQANGIKVVSAGTAGTHQPDRYVDYTVPIPYENAGALMADWGIVKTKGKVHALVVTCSESGLSQTIFHGFKQEFEQYVSADDGSCTVVNATAIELGNGLANKIKTMLENDRKINYIFVCDDTAIKDAISAVVQTGTDTKIVATGGTQEDMDYAQSGSIDMLVAHSYEWTAYAMLDYAMRLSGGLTLPTEQDVPFRVLTKDVIKKAIDEYKDSFDTFHEICFGDAFVTGYNNLWNY